MPGGLEGWTVTFYDFTASVITPDAGCLSGFGEVHARAAANGARHGTPALIGPGGWPDPRVNLFFRTGPMAEAWPGTWRRYAYALVVWLNYLHGVGRSWVEATASDVEAFKAWRLTSLDNAGRVQPTSFDTDRAALNGFYSWAGQRYGVTNPVATAGAGRRPGVPPGEEALGRLSVGRDPLRPAGSTRRQVKWMLRSAFEQWRNIELCGYGFDGLRRPGWRGINEDRDAAFVDGLYGTGLRLAEWASVLDVEIPTPGAARFAPAHVAAACLKGGKAGRTYRIPRSVLHAVAAYTDPTEGSRAEVVRRAQRAGRYQLLSGVRVVTDYRAHSRRLLIEDPGGPRPVSLDVLGPDERRRLEVHRCGGLVKVAGMLCLSPDELAAFAMLLVALTGQNYGTIVAWPAAHFRPDGGLTDEGLALVEACKPRRGPDREHMVIALENLVSGGDREHRWSRSPLRVYRLLLDLGDTARRLSNSQGLLTGRIAKKTAHTPSPWITTLTSKHVQRWAAARGFPTATLAVPGGKPVVSVRRLRLSAIERRRRPVAHTAATMRDSYLMPHPAVQAESHAVVAAALSGEVGKARQHARVPVFTQDFVALARRDPRAPAQQAGISMRQVTGLVEGTQDRVLASCQDHRASPYDLPGAACSASFLACLDCANARALPHQLPIQLAAIDTLEQLRPHLPPGLWARRYAPRLDQLREITAGFQPAEINQARAAITDAHRQRISDLLEGRWDLH